MCIFFYLFDEIYLKKFNLNGTKACPMRRIVKLIQNLNEQKYILFSLYCL